MGFHQAQAHYSNNSINNLARSINDKQNTNFKGKKRPVNAIENFKKCQDLPAMKSFCINQNRS